MLASVSAAQEAFPGVSRRDRQGCQGKTDSGAGERLKGSAGRFNQRECIGSKLLMGKTRVHLLAKELGIETKDFIAQLEKLAIRGRKAQSSLEDDEVARVRAGLTGAGQPPGRRGGG